MKQIILAIFILSSSLFAELIHEYPSQKILDDKTPIVDIRTPPEWRETGLIKGAIPIMFFNQRGGYDVNKFLKELNEKVDTSKKFAIICHTGSRTSILGDFLGNKLNYKVIDLKGGMVYVEALKLPLEVYKP